MVLSQADKLLAWFVSLLTTHNGIARNMIIFVFIVRNSSAIGSVKCLMLHCSYTITESDWIALWRRVLSTTKRSLKIMCASLKTRLIKIRILEKLKRYLSVQTKVLL